MPTLARFTIDWAGGGIAGRAQTSLYYLLGGSGIPGEVITPIALTLQGLLRDNLRPLIPSSVTVAVGSEVQAIDIPTGQIVLVGSPTNGTAPGAGGDAGSYSVASGAVVGLNTADLVAGRRVKGRLFMVPLGGGAYSTSGSLGTGAVNSLQALGNSLVTAGGSGNQLVVFSRPRGARVGAAHIVSSATVRPKVAVLTSRRD